MDQEHKSIEERLEAVERCLGLRGPKPTSEKPIVEALREYAMQLDYSVTHEYAKVIAADLRSMADDLKCCAAASIPRRRHGEGAV